MQPSHQGRLPAPNVILFDWDNTLIDSWSLIQYSINETLGRYGTALGPEAGLAHRYSGKKTTNLLPELLGEDKGKEAVGQYHTAYRSARGSNLAAMPEAENLLQAISQSGLPLVMGVVSNKQGAILREEVQAIGWGKYFRTVVGAMDAARDKPYPDPALLALAEIDRPPSKQVWFVGDSMADISCACSAGLTAIGFGSESSYLIQGEVRPALHVTSHQELWQAIQQLS